MKARRSAQASAVSGVRMHVAQLRRRCAWWEESSVSWWEGLKNTIYTLNSARRRRHAGLYHGVTEEEVEVLTAETAASMAATHQDYAILEARNAIAALHTRTCASFSATIHQLHSHIASDTGPQRLRHAHAYIRQCACIQYICTCMRAVHVCITYTCTSAAICSNWPVCATLSLCSFVDILFRRTLLSVRRYAAASHGRSSPRRRYERA